jgi:HSP20 family protein
VRGSVDMNIIPRKFYLDDIFDDFVPTRNDMKCDIYEKGGDYHIEMDIPGFNKEDIKIESKDGYITVSAEKNAEENDEEKNYIRRERKYGRYERSFYLGDFDDTDVNAEFKDGMLKITVPKKEQNNDKKYIEIK